MASTVGISRSFSVRAPPHPASLLPASPSTNNNKPPPSSSCDMLDDRMDDKMDDKMDDEATDGDAMMVDNPLRSRSRSRSRRSSDNDSAQDLTETSPPPPLVLEPFPLTHPTANTLDFYASLLASVALSLWAKRSLPSTPVQCANCHQLPLTALLKHLLVTTKLPLEQFYLALKYVQVLVSSYPELVHVSKPGSEIRVTIAAIILANKLMEDNYISKRSWARVSSLSLQELNRMELEILDGLHWNLEISVKEYDAWIVWVGDLRRYWRKIFLAPYDPNASSTSSSSAPIATVPSPSPHSSPTAPSLPRTLRHQDSAMSLHSPTPQALTQPPTPRRAGAPVTPGGQQQLPPIRTRTGRSRAVSDSVHRPAMPELPPPGTMPSLPPAAVAANQAAAVAVSQKPAAPSVSQHPPSAVAPHLRHQSSTSSSAAATGRMRSASHSTRLRPDWASAIPAPTAAHLPPAAYPTATPSNMLANLSLAPSSSPSSSRFPPPSMHIAHPVHLAMPTPRRAAHPAAALTGAPAPRYAPGGAGVGPMTGGVGARMGEMGVASATSGGVPLGHLAMAAVVPIALPAPRPTAVPAAQQALHPVREQQQVASRSGSMDASAAGALPVAPEYAGQTTSTSMSRQQQQQQMGEPASAFDQYTHRFDYN